MKNKYAFLTFFLFLVGTVTSGYSQGQGQAPGTSENCSGQFDLTYPSGAGVTTRTFNNGNSNPVVTYCPDGTGSIALTVTETSTGGSFTVKNAAGTTLYTNVFPTAPATFTFSLPISSQTTYTFINTINCNNPKTISVELTLAPSLAITSSAGNNAVCPLTAVTLTATGGTGTYTLRDANGAILGTNNSGIFTVYPGTTTSYTIENTTADCGANTVTQRITVATNNLTLTSNDADNTVSSGTAVILTAGGGTAGGYTWTASDGTAITSTGSQVTVNPRVTTQYTVSGRTAIGNCPTSASLTITVNAVILPVEFASFTAVWAGKAPQLSWATASEKNSASFVIERSLDGLTFAAIGQRAGAGSTTTRNEYQYSDLSLSSSVAGTVYYRLRQVNTDGTFSYSAVKTLLIPTGKAGFKATAFPNPFETSVSVEVEALGAGAITYTVHDVLGKQLLLRTVAASGVGLQKINLPQSATPRAGVYYLTVHQGNQQQVLRISRK